jgi:hypothetical protein
MVVLRQCRAAAYSGDAPSCLVEGFPAACRCGSGCSATAVFAATRAGVVSTDPARPPSLSAQILSAVLEATGRGR